MSGANMMPLSRCDRLSSKTSVMMSASGTAMAKASVAGCNAGGFHCRDPFPFLVRKYELMLVVVRRTESGKLDRSPAV